MSMLDQQLAQQMSTKGIGVADKMLAQLLRNQGIQVGPNGEVITTTTRTAPRAPRVRSTRMRCSA
ncbi:MAG: rod-binding protein [Pararobbsia sp.]